MSLYPLLLELILSSSLRLENVKSIEQKKIAQFNDTEGVVSIAKYPALNLNTNPNAMLIASTIGICFSENE